MDDATVKTLHGHPAQQLAAQIKIAREARGLPVSAVAGAIGRVPATVLSLETGERDAPSVILDALRIASKFNLNPELGASWLWLAFCACGFSGKDLAYIRRILPYLAKAECEGMGGPEIRIREADLNDLAAALGAAVDKVELVLSSSKSETAEALAGAAMARAQTILLDDLVDGFVGETREVRSDVARQWYRELHSACRFDNGTNPAVWHKTPLPSGVTARGTLRRLKGQAAGRREKPLAPQAFRRYLEEAIDNRKSAARAYRIVQVQARSSSNQWSFELSSRSMRIRLGELLKDVPELKQQSRE